MKDIRQNDKVGTIPQSSGADKPALDSKDLTCNEAQVEELLSEGETTEGEADDEDQT